MGRGLTVFSVTLICLSLSCDRRGLDFRSSTSSSGERSKPQSTDTTSQPKMADAAVLLVQQALAEFGYGVRFTARMDEQTKSAVTEYQRHSGLRVTGEVDGETLKRIQEDLLAIRLPNSMCQLFLFISDASSVGAKGIWLPRGSNPNSIRDAENSKISCFKVPTPDAPLGFCEDISVRVDPIEGFRSSSQRYIRLAVVRWSNVVVEAHGMDPFHSNISYVYQFDLNNKKVTKVLIRAGAVPPFEPAEQYDLQDPLETLWKWRVDAAQDARKRIILMPHP